MSGKKVISTLAEVKNGMEIINSDERLVAGWATVEVTDLQGEIVPVDVLREAMLKYMDMGGPIVLAHTNKQVGKVLQWEVREHPETKTPAIWIVAKIERLYPTHDEVWEMIKRGLYKGFSIGGRGARKVVKLKPEYRGTGLPDEVKVLANIELFEISLAPTPANQYATIEAVSLAKSQKKLTLDELLEKYKVTRSELEFGDGCFLCKLVKQLYEECGDLDVAVKTAFVLYQREVSKISHREKLSELLRDLNKQVEQAVQRLESGEKDVWRKWYEQIEGRIQKVVEELAKPFGGWKNFDDCVSDMRSQGYDDDSAKRICGSLQSKLEKVSPDVVKYHKFVEEAIEHIEMAAEALEQTGDDKFSGVVDVLDEACDKLHDILMQEIGMDGIDDSDDELVSEEVMEMVMKRQTTLAEFGFPKWPRTKWKKPKIPKTRQTTFDEFKQLIKDKRPPKKWFDRCLGKTGSPALCGWVFYHNLYPYKPEEKKEPDKPHTRSARARKRAWLGL